MYKSKPRTTVKQSVASVLAGWFKVVLFLVALTGVFLYTRVGRPTRVEAAANSTINFQARLMTAAGGIVPDGTYNVEFKLYNASSSSGSSQGSCSGDANCLWTETRTSGNKVTVRSGYLTANLGSVTSFPSTINWDQQLWLTMNIGGTGAASWDGEMSPRLTLTAVPFALRAGSLATYNGTTGFTSTLSILQPTGGNQTFQIPDQGAAGTYSLLTSTAANAAYIQNQNSADQTADLRISGTARANTSVLTPLLDTASGVALNIGTTNATAINLNQNTAIATGKTLTVTAGATTLTGAAAGSATALTVNSGATTNIGAVIKAIAAQTADLFQIQNSSGSVLTRISASGVVGSGDQTAASTNSTDTTIRSGNATGATSNSGNLILDVGTATGTTGTISIGTTSASAITIGKTGNTTTINSSQLTNNGSTLNTSFAISDKPTGGNIGTAAATVDIYTTFDINQTTASQTITLPTPTSTTSGRMVYVNNVGSASFIMYGSVIASGKSNAFIWNGSSWVTTVSLSGSVVNAIGTIDTQSKSSDGAVISTSAIYLQTADASFPGLVSTGTQTFAGNKTFNGTVTVAQLLTGQAGATISGAAISLNDSSNFNVSIAGGTSTGTVNIGTGTGVQALNFGTGGTGAKTVTVGSTASTSSLTLQAGTGALNIQTQGTGGINIGTNAVAQTIAIGNVTGASAITERVGTGNYSLDGVAASTYDFGASTVAGTFALGGTAQTGALTLGRSTATNTISIGAAAGNGNTQTINIGNSATAGSTTNLVLGSTIAGTTTLQSQGGVKLTTVGASTANSAALCRDSSTTLLTSCDANTTGKPFLQGGNTFAAAATLGTNDNFTLAVETNGTNRATFDTSNNLYFGNAGTTGTAASPNAFTLQGTGSSTAGTAGGALTIKGGAGTTTGAGSTGGVLTLQGGTAGGTDIAGANLVLGGGQGTGTGNGGNVLVQVAKPGTTGSSNNSLATVATFSGVNGSLLLQNSANSTAALDVKSSGGTSVLTVDTTNSLTSVRGISSDASLGSELVTSQAFNNATYWTNCNGGAGGWSGTATNTTHNSGNVVACTSTSSNFAVTAGATYQVSFTVAGNTGSPIQVAIGGGSSSPYIYSNTSNIVVLTASGTGGLTFTPSNGSTFNGTISNVSVKLITQAKSALTVLNSSGTAAIEVRSSSGYGTTFIGISSGQSNNAAQYNTGFGSYTLQNNTNGNYNTALGSSVLTQNTGGASNTGVGAYALNKNTTGNSNTAIGNNSLYQNVTGSNNVGIGDGALYQNVTGSNNVVLGYNTLGNNVSGSNNTIVGSRALQNTTASANNTVLGYYTGYQGSQTDFQTQVTQTGQTLLGAYAQGYLDNSFILGGQGADQVAGYGFGTGQPDNFLSVTPKAYNTGTVSLSSGAGAVTGVGTTFTSSMVGMEIFIASNSSSTAPYKGTISAFTDATHVTVTPNASATYSGRNFYILYPGLQVTSTGKAGIGTFSPTAQLQVVVPDAGSTDALVVDNAASSGNIAVFKANGTAAVTIGSTGNVTLAQNLAANGNTTIGDATTDRLTVTSQILGGTPLVFQGATDNSFATSFAFTDPTANRTITFGDETGTVCTTAASAACTAVYASATGNIVQVPTSTAINTITPTAASVVGLTVNATSSTSAVAAIFNQANNTSPSDTVQINTTNTSGTQTNGLLIARNGAGGTTTNLLNLTNTAGTATNGLTFTGTFTKLINSTNFNVTNAGAVTAVGVDSGAGLLQGSLGLTVTGATANLNASSNFATNINTGTSTGAVSIGNSAAGAITLQSGTSIGLTGITSINASANNATNINSGTSTGTVTIGNSAANVIITDTQWAITGAGAAGFTAITVPGAGTNSEVYGASASAAGNSSLAVGNGATAGANQTVALGASTTASGIQSTAVGYSASTSTYTLATALGYNATVSGNDSTALGGGASAVANSIAIGRGATATAGNQVVFGSNAAPGADLYLGDGVTSGSPNDASIQATGGNAAGVNGAALSIYGGAGSSATTGSAGGNLVLQGGSAGGSGANNGGNVTITGGAKTGAGTTGTISIGTSNTSAITLGATGITTTNAGALTVSQLLTGNLGLTVSGAAISLNDSSNFNVSIAGGTSTGTVNVGTGTGVQTLNFGTGGTGAKTVTVGSTASSSVLALQSGTNGISFNTAGTSRGIFDTSNNLYLGNADVSGVAATPNNFTVQGTGSSTAGTAGAMFIVRGGAGASTTTGSAGGIAKLLGGDAGGSGNNNGGAVTIQGGSSVNTATGGAVTIQGGTGVTGGSVTIDAGANVGGLGSILIGNNYAGNVSICNSAACDTVTIGTNGDADTLTFGDASDTVGINGAITLGASAGSGSLTNNGATINTVLAKSDFPTGGSIGTAATTVDVYTAISVSQTTASQTLTLATPTASTTYGRVIYISNIGTASFTLAGSVILPGTTAALTWSNTNGGASWQYVGDGGGSGNYIQNQNSTTQTANFLISGTGTANTSFLSPVHDALSGGTLSLGTSNATAITIGKSGITTTNAGALTVAQLLTGNLGATISGAAISLNDSSNFGVSIAGGTSTGQVDIGTGTGVQTLNFGTGGTGAKTVTVGSTASTGLTTIQAGTAGVRIQPANGTTALDVRTSGNTSVLTVDTTNSQTSVRGINSDAVIGSELVTSQDFTSANWTTCNGGAGGWSGTITTATHNTGNTFTCSAAAGNFSVTAGATYQVTFTLAGNTTASNTVGVTFGGSGTTSYGANATYTTVYTASTTASLIFSPSTNFNGTISAVSVKQITLSNSALNVLNSSGTTSLEVRASGTTTNSFIGLSAGASNSTGSYDTAFGAGALFSNTTGIRNTAVGYNALKNNTTGNYNVGLGYNALRDNSTGIQNVAIGGSALATNLNGNGNIAIGGADTTQGALNQNKSGNYSIALGISSLGNNTTGSYNVALGYQTGYRGSQSDFQTQATQTNQTLLGAYTQGYLDNSFILGGQGADQVAGYGFGTGQPDNFLSVTPKAYNTGTVSLSSGAAAVTGSGTTFTSSMVGMEIFIASNSATTAPYKGTISAFTDATHVTVTPNASATYTSRNFYILYPGLQVTSTGKAGIGTFSPTAQLQVVVPDAGSTDALVVDNATSTGNIFIAKDNGTAVFTIADGGAVTATQLITGQAGLTVTGAAISLNDSSNFNVSIAGGTSTGTVNIGTGTGVQALNFGTGGTGAKTVTVGSTASTSSLTLDAGTGTIGIGTSASARTVNIATGAAAQVVTLGSNTSSSSLALQAGTGGLQIVTNSVGRAMFDTSNNLYLGNANTSGTAAAPNNFSVLGTSSSAATVAGGALTVQSGAGNTSGAGGALTVAGGTGGATGTGGLVTIQGGAGGATSGAGGALSLVGGAATAGNSNGGAASLTGGAGTGTGNGGALTLTGGAGGTGANIAGGAVSITGGSAALGTFGTGGAVSITGGSGFSNPGAVTIQGGWNGFSNYGVLSLQTTGGSTTLGNTTGASAVTINSGTGNIDIGTGAQARTVNLGTGAAAQTVNVGSTNTTSTTTIQSGSGGVILSGATSVSGSNTFTSGTGTVLLQGNTDIAATKSFATKAGTTYTTPGSANDVAISTASFYLLDTSGAAQTLTGIVAGRDGQLLTLVNADAAASVTLSNESSSSAAANRITTGTGSDLTMLSGASVSLIYDATNSRWRVVGISSNPSGYANTSLSNLSSVAVNTSLNPGTDNTLDLGSTANSWRTLYADTSVLTAAVDYIGGGSGTLSIGTTNATTVAVCTTANCDNINIGTGGDADTIAIGDSTDTTTLNGSTVGINGTTTITGTTGIVGVTNINVSANNATNINTGTSTGAVTIGNNTGNTALTLDSGTGTIAIGTGAQARTVNLGTGAAAQTVNVGSTNTTSTTTIQSGSGGVILSGATSVSGSNTFTSGTGTVLLQGNTDVAATASLATKVGTTFTTAGTSNNAALNVASFYLLDTSGSAQVINGITAGRDGQQLTLTNVDASLAVTLSNNSGSATGSKIITGTGADISIPVGGTVSLIYDSANTVWRVDALGAVSGGFANQQLSNLSGTVAVNLALNPGTDNTLDLGSTANSWRTLYADTSVLTAAVDYIGGGSGTLSIGTTNATTVAVCTTANCDTINIGTGGDADTIAIGDSTDTTTLNGSTIGINGTTTITGTTGIVGTANINVSANNATNINTGTSTGAVNIGNSAAGAIAIQSASTISLTGTTTVTALSGGSTQALVVNNSTSTGNILEVQDNGTAVFTVADGGGVSATGKVQIGATADVGTIAQCDTSSGLVTGTCGLENVTQSTETGNITNGQNFVTSITPSAASNTAQNSGTNSYLLLNGSQSFTNNNYAVAGWGVNLTSAGTVTQLVGNLGYSVQAGAGSTVTDLIGAKAGVAQLAGTVTNGYGINVTSASGTIGTNYGIKVDAQTAGTTDYGIAVGAADTQTLWLSNNADNTTAAAGIAFGASRDTNLYRSAASTLKTDGKLQVGSQIAVGSTASITSNIVAEIKETYTTTGAVFVGGSENAIILNAASNSASLAIGNSNTVTTQGTAINYTSVVNDLGQAGSSNTFIHSGTGTVTRGTGVYGALNNQSTGTITTGSALTGFLQNNSSGTITTANGLNVSLQNTSTGTITTANGISVAATTNSGTLTNNYGINVAAQTAGTNDYGIAVGAADTQTLWLSSDADNVTAAAGIAFGVSRDTTLYRSAAGRLQTDGDIYLSNGATRTIKLADATSSGAAGNTFAITGSSGATSGTNGGAGGALTITAGSGATNGGFNTVGGGGALTLQAGASAAGWTGATAGAVNITAGSAGATANASTGIGGAINLTTGNGSSGTGSFGTNSNGGAAGQFVLQGGTGGNAGGTSNNNGGIGGGFTLTAGAGGTALGTGTGGAAGVISLLGAAGGASSSTSAVTGGTGTVVTINTGAGGAVSGASGAVVGGAAGGFTVQGGAGGAVTASATAGATGGAGSTITINAGAGGAVNTGGAAATVGGNGGGITLQAAAGGAVTSSGGASGSGGSVTINAGNAGTGGSTNKNGGAINLTAGNGNLAGVGGAIGFTAGTGGATGTGGALSLQGGAGGATSGAGGALSLQGGTATTSGNGGAVSITGGTAGGANTGGAVTIQGGTGTTGGALSLLAGFNGNTSAALNIGTVGSSTKSSTINIANTSDGTSVQTISIGSTANTANAVTLSAGATGYVNLNTGQAQFSEVTGTRILTVQTRSSNVAGSNLTVSAGAAGSGASAFSGGTLTLQGGAAGGTGNANGGSVTISGGAGVGTGAQGLVNFSPAAFSSVGSTQTFAVTGSLTAGLVDQYSTIPINASATGVTVTIPSPASGNQVVGRILYVTAVSGSNDFTLLLSGTSISISMKANSTATLIWNGTGWTAAGASSSTDLQSAYNNTIASAGGAELVLNAPGGNADGLTIRNNSTTPITGALLEVQTSIGSNLLSVNNNATEYASNGGAETAGGTSSTFPSSTWSTSPNGGTTATISRDTTSGEYATGQASAKVVTTGATTANQGVANQLSTTLTANLQYTVSFTVKGNSNFSTLDVYYSKDGTNTSPTSCSTGNTVKQTAFTRINCTFTAPSSGITSSNAIFIRQSDSNTTAQTYFVDNLSVTINASVDHSADGSVSNSGTFSTNWVAVGGTVTRDTTNIYDTSGAVSVAVSTTANRGVYNFMGTNGITPTASATGVQYRASFYIKANTGTVTLSTSSVYYSPDGNVTKKNCYDLSTTSIATTAGYTLVSCTFTTDNTTASAPRFYITNTATTDFYVDALTITLNTNTANNVQIGGANKGGPITLLTLDRSYGTPIAANNDAYLGSMYFDTSTNSIQCYGTSGWGACGAAPDNIVNLNPEYAGAVLNGTGIGTMTADFCGNGGGLSVNTSFCASGEARNYYKWTSPQASQQTYSIYVTYQLPSTFKSFASDNTVQLTGRVDSTSNAAVTYQMFSNSGGSLTACGTETTVTTSINTWQTVGINGNESTGCSFSTSSAGSFIIFKINMKAQSNANAYVSTLSFTTKGQ